MAEGECQQDRQKFCKNETRANVGACLDQHTDELSEACKAMREARALASPASAETSRKPPNAQTEGNLPEAESKPGEVAEQPESTEAQAAKSKRGGLAAKVRWTCRPDGLDARRCEVSRQS